MPWPGQCRSPYPQPLPLCVRGLRHHTVCDYDVHILAAAAQISFNFVTENSSGKWPSTQSSAITERYRSIYSRAERVRASTLSIVSTQLHSTATDPKNYAGVFIAFKQSKLVATMCTFNKQPIDLYCVNMAGKLAVTIWISFLIILIIQMV